MSDARGPLQAPPEEASDDPNYLNAPPAKSLSPDVMSATKPSAPPSGSHDSVRGAPPVPPPLRLNSDDSYLKPVPPLYLNTTPPVVEDAPVPPLYPGVQISKHQPTFPTAIASSVAFPDDPAYRPVPSVTDRPQPASGGVVIPHMAGRTNTSSSRFRPGKSSVTAASMSSGGSVSSRKGSSVRFNVTDDEGASEGGTSWVRAKHASDRMDYLVDDVPPWYLCLLLGFQHYLIMFGATAANPIVLSSSLGIHADDGLTKSRLIQTIFVVSGIVTFLQATFGIRLPIIQGGTITFVAPIIALLKLQKYSGQSVPFTNGTEFVATVNYTQAWQTNIREVQGAIMVSSLFQVFIGFSGIMGVLLRFIGPLSIAPTITLAGLSLFDVALNYSGHNWWITLVTVVLIAAFSQYTKNINVPCAHFEKGKGFTKIPFPVFRLFPVILAMSIAWILTKILEATNALSTKNEVILGCNKTASASDFSDVLDKARWFYIPYPGQWGLPTVSIAGVFGLLAGVLANMVESVGDYYACARISGASPPPLHAINRGIGIEGLGCILAGAFGSSSGTTSYSENIGAIGITKVSSRRVIQCAAAIMVVFGIFGKLGIIFILIPRPIVGGVFIVMFGMVAAVGISNLQFVNLNSSRNLFIIGFSFFFGIKLPYYLNCNEGIIQTGSPIADQIFTVLLKTNMFVGGMSAFILDNTIPGTDDERGLRLWKSRDHTAGVRSRDADGAVVADTEVAVDSYDIPLVAKYLAAQSWTRFIPFLPTFDESLFTIRKKKKKRMRASSARRPPVDGGGGADDTTL